MSRSLRTLFTLTRGWVRLQVGHPVERPHRSHNLLMSVHGIKTSVAIRDNESDVICLLDILVRGAYDAALEAASRRQVSTIYDIGANIGIASLLFRIRIPEATIVAFEPGYDELRHLDSNLSDTALILPIALTGTGLKLQEFRVSPFASGGQHLASCWTEAEGRFDFESRHVLGADLQTVSSLGLPHADFVKIDVEGAESPIVRSFLSSESPPTVLVVEAHSALIATEIALSMQANGYMLLSEEEGRLDTSVLTFELPSRSGL